MRVPAQNPVRGRKTQLANFPAPTAGWISNRNLAAPGEQGGAAGAAMLENWFPTATSIVLRRGSELYATLGLGDKPVTAMFTYVVGDIEQFFASNENTIYDVTSPNSPFNLTLGIDDTTDEIGTDTGDVFGIGSTTDLEVSSGYTGGNWVVVQFATAGGTFLIGVNGQDDGFIYDGVAFYPLVAGGVRALNYDAETVPFVVGGVLTGGTSAATGTIFKVTELTGTTGTVYLTGITGTFQNNETITGSLGGSATSDGVGTIVTGTNYSFPVGVALTTADLSYVWAYKTRLWFIQRNSLDAWYLDVDQISGELTLLPLGGVFNRGGSLVFGQTWSLDSGASGGLSEQNIFATSEGEVAVYQGDNPEDAATWGKVGVYRIGNPLGNKSFIRAGGDLIISTNIGFIPLSQAIQRDVAALTPAAVSFPIEVAWNTAVDSRVGDWHAETWPEGQMVAIALPPDFNGNTGMFIANARTGAWANFTNWNGTCLDVFQGRLFFGSTDGRVVEAMVTGLDEGAAYTGRYLPLFDDFGLSAQLKAARMALPTIRSQGPVNVQVNCQYDFDLAIPAPPSAAAISAGSQWGIGVWGQSVWGGRADSIVTMGRDSLAGVGYRMATALQITSGSLVPLDAEVVSVQATYEPADTFT